jgi:hypothetical protein
MSTKKLPSDGNDLPILMDSIYCLHRIGDHSSAKLLADEGKFQLEATQTFKSINKLLELIGNYYQNNLTTSHFAELKNAHSHIIDSNLNLYIGWSHFLHGYFLKQKESLINAASFFKDGEHYQELYETYYWMDKFRVLPVEEKTLSFLRLYPIKTIYSRLMGNKYFEKELSPATTLEKVQMQSYDSSEDDHFDCWLIKEKNIMPASYHQLEIQDEENFLDLYSGLINDRGEFTFLMISELNCLSYLIASQLTGTSVSTVAEFLERKEEEALALILSLKKMGIPITERNGMYFLEWTSKPSIIIPRSLKVIGLQEFVRKKKSVFSKAQLIELLQLTQFGAEALLRKWALAGFIRPVEAPDKSTLWKFVN